MRSISPELVLVDPELAAHARELLPDPGDCLAPRLRLEPVPELRAPVPAVQPVPAPAPAPRPLAPPAPRRRRRRVPVSLAAAWLVAAAVAASPLLAFLPPPDSEVPRLVDAAPQPSPPRSGNATRSARPTASTATTSPQPRKPVTTPSKSSGSPARPARPLTPVVLRWPADARAAYYDVILVRAGERLDLWPKRNELTLLPGAKARSTVRGSSVRYTWFAYPAFPTGSRVRYGGLLAHGTVSVPRGYSSKASRPPARQSP